MVKYNDWNKERVKKRVSVQRRSPKDFKKKYFLN